MYLAHIKGECGEKVKPGLLYKRDKPIYLGRYGAWSICIFKILLRKDEAKTNPFEPPFLILLSALLHY